MKNKSAFTAMLLVLVVATLAWSVTDRVMEDWKKALKFGISSQRSGVIRAIQDSKTVDAYPLIVQALTNDDNPDIRGMCAYSLLELKVSNEGPWMASLSVESNSDVLRKVTFGAGELKVASAAPRMMEILQDRATNAKDSQLNAVLIRSLGNLAYKPSSSYLLGLLTNTANTTEIRSSAAIALGGMSDNSFIPVFDAILQNTGEQKEVRMYAAYALGRTGDPSVLNSLGPIIDDEKEDLNVRLWGIAGLAYVKNESVFPKLLAFSRGDTVRVRLEAVKALSKYSNAQSIEVLTFKALYDPEAAVKKEAVKSLQILGIEVPEIKANAATNAWSTNAKPAVVSNAAPVKTTNTVKPK